MPDMRSAEPYLPSYTLAVAQGNYSSRLPAYRVSHMLRYHPYPRYSYSRPSSDILMETIEERGEVSEHEEITDFSNSAASNDSDPFSHDGKKEEGEVAKVDPILHVNPDDVDVKLGRAIRTPSIIDISLYLLRKIFLADEAQPVVAVQVVDQKDDERDEE